MQVIPILKNIKISPGSLDVGKKIKIDYNDFNNSVRLTARLSEFVNDYIANINAKENVDSDACLRIIKNNAVNEAYQILVNEQGIKICSGTEMGAFYAIQTLKQLITPDLKIPFVDISDFPDLPTRGLMLDISRSKVPTMDTLKNIVKLLASLKYNHLELYLEGFSFEYKEYPFVLKDGNYLSIDEYQELEKFCNDYFIDLVPNENGFGHMQDWLLEDQFKPLAEVDDLFEMWGSKRTSSTIDVTNPKSIEFVKSLYDQLLPYSNSKYFNMNFDEPFELGHGKSKEVCDSLGIENVFVDYFLTMQDYVRKYQKTPMIWGDVLINHPEAIKRLPKDVVFIDWGYNVDYPYEKNLKMLNELGVRFMAAPATSTWSVITARYLEMTTSIRKACFYTKQYHGEGMILTDWGDIGHLQYLPYSYPGIIYGAMCSWNVEKAPEYLIKEYLEKIVGTNLAGIILDLSTYTRLEGEYRSYGSKLFSPILHAEGARNEKNKVNFFLNKMRFNLLNQLETKALQNELETLKNRIIVADDLIYREVLGSITLLQYLLKINVMLQLYYENQPYIEQLEQCIGNLQSYAQVHKELWEARNKKEGYPFSMRRLDQLISILKEMKERGN